MTHIWDAVCLSNWCSIHCTIHKQEACIEERHKPKAALLQLFRITKLQALGCQAAL